MAGEDYAYWKARLNGEKPILTRDGEPGFWRWRRKPVAVWIGTGGVMFRKMGKEEAVPVDREWSESVFSRACSDPVTEPEYRAALETGEWPDDPPKIGDNSGATEPLKTETPFDRIVRILQEQEEQVEMWLGDKPEDVIVDKPSCDRAANWASTIRDLEVELEQGFRVEKQPWLDGGRAVDAKWREPRATAEELKKRLKNAQLPYLSEQERLRREQERRAQEEREAAARAAREAAARAEEEARRKGLDEAAQKRAAEAAAEAHLPTHPQQTEPKRNTNAGSVGKKTSLIKVKVGVIEDYDKALMALKDHRDVKELVQQLADRAAKAGVPVAGIRFEDREAVR